MAWLKCKTKENTLYGSIGWDLYFREKRNLYICNKYNIGYSDKGYIYKKLKNKR